MAENPSDETWRLVHLGRLLAMASARFDAHVLALMANDNELTLALSHLAARGTLTASHTQITRHLPLAGCSLTELASRAGVTKQAMGKLVDQCSATGSLWLAAYRRAVEQAQAEFTQAVGRDVATVVQLGLEAYAN